MKTMKKHGFTLVEILIVVIILGILAAIIIPQFTDASTEAKESTLTSNLQVLRSQVGLFKIQHNDNYPGDTDADSVPDDVADFVADMIGRTDIDGTADAVGDFGPYMQNFPNNPFVDAANPAFEIVANVAVATLDGSTHWAFLTDTNSIIANDGGVAPDGVTNHEDL